jgi:diguanylate cyclase (GGDEF)-like protein
MNKNIITLFVSFLIGFIIFVLLHFSFLTLLEQKDREADELRIKQMISADINYKIMEIKALFLDLPLVSTNIYSLKLNQEKLDKKLEEISDLIFILKNGGVYHKVIPLNLVNRDSYAIKYHYSPSYISFEVIDLEPKIALLKQKEEELSSILNDYIREKSDKSLYKLRIRVTIFIKKLNSIFNRMIENSNRMFYETQYQLSKLETEMKKDSSKYRDWEFILIFLLVLIEMTGAYIVFKELSSLNRKLRDRLYKDQLTDVFSRAKLEEIDATKNSFLMLIDIDSFSDINELYGIEIGNRVLQVVAQRLKNSNPNCMIFRVSADVFGLYIDDFQKLEISIEEKVEAIRESLIFEPIEIDEYIIDINVTIGIAFGKKVLNDSLVALSIAKEEKLLYKVFHNEHEFKQQIEFNKKWQREIKLAIRDDRIVPFFQPIVDREGKIIKYETLMRLKEEEKYIPPFFMDIAIKTKQYISLSQITIKKAFEKFENGGEFTINLGYLDIKNSTTKHFLEELIIKYRAKNRVTFEILEGESFNNYMEIKEFLNYFKKYGVKIAIDDFGAGYSNFKRVVELEPDYIKLDSSLIKNVYTDKNSYLIVKTIVNYAKELNIKIVAEFIHDKDTLDTCLYLGVDYFQGFYIGRPSPEISF